VGENVYGGLIVRHKLSVEPDIGIHLGSIKLKGDTECGGAAPLPKYGRDRAKVRRGEHFAGGGQRQPGETQFGHQRADFQSLPAILTEH
jgi:hypothetical protein